MINPRCNVLSRQIMVGFGVSVAVWVEEMSGRFVEKHDDFIRKFKERFFWFSLAKFIFAIVWIASGYRNAALSSWHCNGGKNIPEMRHVDIGMDIGTCKLVGDAVEQLETAGIPKLQGRAGHYNHPGEWHGWLFRIPKNWTFATQTLAMW